VLVPVGTVTSEGLTITRFASVKDPDVHAFYVVPQEAGPEGPWFRVVVIAPEYCLHAGWPVGARPVIEKVGGPPGDAIDVVRRICRKREGRP
jgi:hypothetical protein